MNQKNKLKGKEKINFLDLIPIRTTQWEKRENELVVLLKPKFRNKLIAKYILPKMKNPFFRIKLDEIGSFVWKLCNEKNTVWDIGVKLKEEFGEKIEPVYDRLIIFLKQLERGKCIKFKLKKEGEP